MITAIVQFPLATPISLPEASRLFESSAPKYQNLPGLIRVAVQLVANEP